jgi:hypothetical protein
MKPFNIYHKLKGAHALLLSEIWKFRTKTGEYYDNLDHEINIFKSSINLITNKVKVTD